MIFLFRKVVLYLATTYEVKNCKLIIHFFYNEKFKNIDKIIC